MKGVLTIIFVLSFLTISVYGQNTQLKCKTQRIVVVPYPFNNASSQGITRAFTTAAAMNPCFLLNDIYSIMEGSNSPAITAISNAKNILHKGIQAFTASFYEKAADLFKQASDIFLPNYTASGMSRDVADTFLYLGSALAVLNHTKRAKDAFLMALTLDPAADIFSITSLPDATDLFQNVQSQQKSLSTGGISVTSLPAGSLVYVDGSFKGSTPVKVTGLRAGKHVISLMMVGFQRETRIVKVMPDTTANMDIVPMKITARASLLSENIRRLIAGDEQAYVDAKGLVASDLMVVCQQKSGQVNISLFDLNRRIVFSRKLIKTGNKNVQKAKQVLNELFHDASQKLRVKNSPIPSGRVSSSIVKKWWFWTAIGVAVVGGTTAAVLLTRHGGSSGMEKNGTGSIILEF